MVLTLTGGYVNYECADCRSQGRQDGLYGYDITQAMRKAEDYFIDVMAEEVIETESNN